MRKAHPHTKSLLTSLLEALSNLNATDPHPVLKEQIQILQQQLGLRSTNQTKPRSTPNWCKFTFNGKAKDFYHQAIDKIEIQNHKPDDTIKE